MLIGFTVKKLGSGCPTQEDYVPLLKLLASKGTIIDFSYETDSKGKLHIHGIFEVIKQPYFKSLLPRGFHFHYQEVYDYEGWSKYIHKDTANEHESQQLADSVYCRKNYIFNKVNQA